MRYLYTLSRRSLRCACVAALIALSSSAWTQQSDDAAVSAQADSKVEQTAQEQTTQKRKQIVQEASNAIAATQDALKALDEGQGDQALSALELAAGKLAIILAREPALALAPAHVSTTTYDVLSSHEQVAQLRERAIELLEAGHMQDARRLLDDLASEIVISVTNIPLATYPDAIASATRQIDAGDLSAARQTLQTALNTLVIADTVIPLPVASARELLAEAETLAEKENRSKAENQRLGDLLTVARQELEFGEVLGYGTEKDFRTMYAQLDVIEKKTSDGRSGEGFFAEIKSSLADMFGESQSESEQQIQIKDSS